MKMGPTIYHISLSVQLWLKLVNLFIEVSNRVGDVRIHSIHFRVLILKIVRYIVDTCTPFGHYSNQYRFNDKFINLILMDTTIISVQPV